MQAIMMGTCDISRGSIWYTYSDKLYVQRLSVNFPVGGRSVQTGHPNAWQ